MKTRQFNWDIEKYKTIFIYQIFFGHVSSCFAPPQAVADDPRLNYQETDKNSFIGLKRI